jgi:hypothetical protein
VKQKYSSAILKSEEPMAAFGICSYGLMQDIAQGVIVQILPNADSSIWNCTLECVRKNADGTSELLSFIKSDFTKKACFSKKNY